MQRSQDSLKFFFPVFVNITSVHVDIDLHFIRMIYTRTHLRAAVFKSNRERERQRLVDKHHAADNERVSPRMKRIVEVDS